MNMSRLGFQHFRMNTTIRRTARSSRWSGLRRYICSARPPSIFGLLGPPEVPRSTIFTVNSFSPDDTQDPLRDRLINNPRVPYKINIQPEKSCRFFCASYTYKRAQCCEDKPHILQYYLELSWSHCPQTTLKLICLLRSTGRFSKQSREHFYTAAVWLHRYHSQTLAYNVGAFAKFGSLKDLLEILYRILNGSQVRQNQSIERESLQNKVRFRIIKNEVRYSKSKVMLKRSVDVDTHLRNETRIIMQRDLLLLHILMMLKKKNFIKEIQIKTREEQKRRKSKVRQNLRKEKRIMMATKAVERYNSDPKYRLLHNQISNLFADLLKADLDYLISGQLQKISLASKWCPSLDSSYDRSTLLCESVARKLFPYHSCPEYRELDESHYAYRIRNRLQKQVLVPLRRALELPEIYMTARQWNLIPYDRIASNVMKNYKRLFYKHDHDRFLQHLQNVQCPPTTTKQLLPHEILTLLGYDSGHDEIAELQWKRMLDSYSSKEKFVNCISVIDSSLFHVGYDCTERFCLAFALMTSELCASPWRRKVLTYNLDNLEFVNIEGDDLGSRITFLRSLPILCECPNLIQLLDKILDTAKDLKLGKENMIARIFFFDQYIPTRYINSFSGWKENYGRMREKYERNGYVMPKIVYWSNEYWGNWVEQREGDITRITTSAAKFRNFLECSETLSLMAEMESKICSEDYLKLVVHD